MTAEAQTENTLVAGKDIGVVDASLAKSLKKLDPMEEIPSFVPGKNLEVGMSLAGRYLHTKRVYSEKFTAGKRDASGRKYRDLHVLADVKSGAKFGIWSVGQLGIIFDRARPATSEKPGQYMVVKYTGLAKEALRQGESPAHEFDVTSDEDLGERNAH